MNPATAAARGLVGGLAAQGLAEAAIAPGSRSAPLALALYEHPGVRLHVRIDERSAAFLALGLAKTARRPAAVACTSGSAAANLFPAVIEADAAGVPLIVLTADRPPELRDTGANQTIDQLKLYGGAIRWFCEVGVPEAGPEASGVQAAYWRSLAARAWAEASGAAGRRPGPVHVNAAFREPLLPASGSAQPWWSGAAPVAVTTGSREPSAADVDRLTALIDGSDRGVLVAGDADLPDARPLRRLAERAGWPILAEPTSGLRAGPNAVSAYHYLVGHDPLGAAEAAPDLFVVVGKTGLSRPLLGLLEARRDVPQVLLDADGAWLDPTRSLHWIVVSDPALTAAAVAARIAVPRDHRWLRGWLDREAEARHAIDALLDAADTLSEPRIARDLAALLPHDGLLVAASSMPIRDLNLVMAPREGLRIIGNRGASGIDGFVSTAVGAALAHEGPTVALAGDLSLLHDQNGLLIAAGEPRPDLVIVVVNNDGGGIFSLLPQAGLKAGFERLFGTPHGMDLAAVAAAAGWGYERLERAGDLGKALVGGGLRLVEVRTDRLDNAHIHERLRHEVATALG